MSGYIVNKRRLALFITFIVLCFPLAFEASSNISIKDGVLKIEYYRCWSLCKSERTLPVSDITRVFVLIAPPNKGTGGPNRVIINSRAGEELRFGGVASGWGTYLGNKAFRIKEQLLYSIRTRRDLEPIKIYPLNGWLMLAGLISLICPLCCIVKLPQKGVDMGLKSGERGQKPIGDL